MALVAYTRQGAGGFHYNPGQATRSPEVIGMPKCAACGAEPEPPVRGPHTVYVKTLHRVGGRDHCRHHIIKAVVAAGLIRKFRGYRRRALPVNGAEWYIDRGNGGQRRGNVPQACEVVGQRRPGIQRSGRLAATPCQEDGPLFVFAPPALSAVGNRVMPPKRPNNSPRKPRRSGRRQQQSPGW